MSRIFLHKEQDEPTQDQSSNSVAYQIRHWILIVVQKALDF